MRPEKVKVAKVFLLILDIYWIRIDSRIRPFRSVGSRSEQNTKSLILSIFLMIFTVDGSSDHVVHA